MKVPYHRNPLIPRQSKMAGHSGLWCTFYKIGKSMSLWWLNESCPPFFTFPWKHTIAVCPYNSFH